MIYVWPGGQIGSISQCLIYLHILIPVREHLQKGWIYDISDPVTDKWISQLRPQSLLSSLSLSPGLAQGGHSWHPWEGSWPRPHLSAPRPDPHLPTLCMPCCTFHTPLISQNSDSLHMKNLRLQQEQTNLAPKVSKWQHSWIFKKREYFTQKLHCENFRGPQIYLVRPIWRCFGPKMNTVGQIWGPLQKYQKCWFPIKMQNLKMFLRLLGSVRIQYLPSFGGVWTCSHHQSVLECMRKCFPVDKSIIPCWWRENALECLLLPSGWSDCTKIVSQLPTIFPTLSPPLPTSLSHFEDPPRKLFSKRDFDSNTKCVTSEPMQVPCCDAYARKDGVQNSQLVVLLVELLVERCCAIISW